MIRTVDVPNCILCNAPGKQYYSNLTDVLFATDGEWHLDKCSNPDCDLFWLNPRPTEEDIPLIYANYYTHSAVVSARKPSLVRWFKNSLMLGTRWALAKSTGLWNQIQKREFMYLGHLPPGQLLEVGCGAGIFLDRMRRNGWVVKGVELDPQAAQVAQQHYGLDVIVGTVESAELSFGSYDAVVLSHVIEHVLDPIALLARCRALLRVGGILVVTTPNIDSLGHQRFGKNWRGLEPPRHLQIFSGRTLTMVAERAGFSTIQLHTSAATADYLLFSSQEIERRRQGDEITTNDRVQFLLRTFCVQYEEFYKLRSNQFLGEEIVMLCSN